MALLPIRGGHVAVVPADLFDGLRRWTWRLGSRGYPYRRGRVGPAGRRRRHDVLLHHEVLPRRPGRMVDHIDGNTLNARRSNLRYADASENQFNQRRVRGRVPLKGVDFHRASGMYRARIRVRGARLDLGCYADPLDAARAYWAASERLHGAFAYTNLPQDERRSIDSASRRRRRHAGDGPPDIQPAAERGEAERTIGAPSIHPTQPVMIADEEQAA